MFKLTTYTLRYSLSVYFLFICSTYSFSQGSQTFTSSGTFTVPACVTSITVQCWAGGGGGGGGNETGGGSCASGGGGGGFAQTTINNPTGVYTVVVGAGGQGAQATASLGPDGSDGANSVFTNGTDSVVAVGGQGGFGSTGGTTTAVGAGNSGYFVGWTGITYTGGNGGQGNNANHNIGGSGGGGAGSTANGGNAGNASRNTLGTAGAGGATGGGSGGVGVNNWAGNGGNGSSYGGGGAGGGGANNSHGSTQPGIGGDGAQGQVIVTYYTSPPTITSVTGTGCPGSATTVTITGTNLSAATSVTVGSTALTNLNITNTVITGTLAAGSSSGIVTVTNGACGSASSTTPFVVNTAPVPVNLGIQSICALGSYSFGGISYTTPGTYYDTATSVVTGCDSITTVTLVVNPLIYKTTSATICANSSYSFGGNVYATAGTYIDTATSLVTGCDSFTTLTLSVTPIIYQTIRDTICANGSFSFGGNIYSTAGTYTDTTNSVVTGCDSITILDLVVTIPSAPSVSANKSVLCPGDSTQICVSSSGLTSYIWSTGDISPCIYSKTIGSTSYTITVTDGNGCTAVGTSLISLSSDTIIIDTTSGSASCNQATGFIAVNPSGGSGGYLYAWSGGKTSATIDSLVAGIYQVTVSDNAGCSATMSYTIANDSSNCETSLVVFPNAFTPNGDGMNDVFTVAYTPDIDHYQMRIYDRWGQTVYESLDITQGWDGTYRGNPEPMGVYIWFAQYGFTDKPGTEAKTGSITLIR